MVLSILVDGNIIKLAEKELSSIPMEISIKVAGLITKLMDLESTLI